MKEKSEKDLKDKENKKAEKEKMKKEKKENKTNKEKKPNKFMQIVKKRWLINGTKTTILVLVILAVFFAINILMQQLELTPLDFSAEKLYTLTDESKEKVKDINKQVDVYFVGYSEDDSTLDLAKQYHKANEKINVEAVSVDSRPDLAEKYGIQSGDVSIIVECGEKFKVLSTSDLVSYDINTYESYSVAEEKLTASIMQISTDDVPKVYFLTGYSDFTLSYAMQYLNK